MAEQSNPQAEEIHHEFILGWESPTAKGDHLIKEFMLRHDYKCKFYCVINDQGICYKAFVFNEENSDYVNLSNLPFDVQYMAYYLQDTISFNFNKN